MAGVTYTGVIGRATKRTERNMLVKFRSDLCETVNLKTGKSTYYIAKCGVFQRVASGEFHQRNAMPGCEYENLHSKTSRGVRRYYTTVVWQEECNRFV